MAHFKKTKSGEYLQSILFAKSGTYSVTTCVNYLFNIWSLATIKICPEAYKNCHSRFKLCKMLNKL